MNRKISLSIEDMYIKYAGEAFGATGSHNALTLRMIFGPAWDGTAKTAYFTDALGSASVSIVLGLDKLVGGAYEVDVPSEALKYAGEATVTIKGVLTSGDTTTKAITTAAGHFRVLDSELPESAGNVGTITPSDKEQLQAEIDGLENLFTTTKTAAETAAANAKVSETNAKASETAASGSASDAAGSAAAAAQSAASVAGINKTAESWAVGGTGTREGENTNNAKYWAQQAQATVGGDFATKTEAQGYVADHNQSATAHSDIREAVSEAGKAFVIIGMLVDDGASLVVDKTRAEVKAAVQANRAVIMRISIPDDAAYDLLLLRLSLGSGSDGSDSYLFCGAIGSEIFVAHVDFTDTDVSSYLETGVLPKVGDTVPSAPGMASSGTSDDAARADHVHPSERPKAAQVTLTAAGWDASTKKQTVPVSGVSADMTTQVVWVTFLTETALDAYMDAGIVPVAQGANSVTFRADTIPTETIPVTVVMQEVSA